MMHNHHHNPHQPFHNRQGIVFDSIPTEENTNNHQESAAALSKSCSAAAAAEEQTPLQRPRPPEHHAFANGANGYANDDGCAAPTLATAQQVSTDQLNQMRYRHIGPVGNRVTSVTGVIGDRFTYYAGAASGGARRR